MRHAHFAVAAAALLAGCGQPLLSMQLDVPEIRIVSPGKDFPATGAADLSFLCDGLNQDCVFSDAEYDIGEQLPVLNENGVDFDLRLTGVALCFASGDASDLSGISSALVKIQDPGTGLWTVVASYTRPPGATPMQISVSGNSNLELAPYLSSGKLQARIELSFGSPPPGAFTASIEARFSLVVTVSYDAFL